MADNSFFIKCLGISQDPKTCNYMMIMEFAYNGSFHKFLNSNITWKDRLHALLDISIGLDHLHNNNLIHQDFHPGNLLLDRYKSLYITDLGSCKSDKSENQNSQSNGIYGVMPYVAPEVLRGKPYTKAADIYSFGMIMYFTATGKQPFADHAHNSELALNICNGIRPELNELEAPKCYINLMKKCWDSNPENRPNADDVKGLIKLFYDSYESKDNKEKDEKDEIKKQFEAAEKYRKQNPLSNEESQLTTHPQAIYTSRLLNPYTDSLRFDFTE